MWKVTKEGNGYSSLNTPVTHLNIYTHKHLHTHKHIYIYNAHVNTHAHMCSHTHTKLAKTNCFVPLGGPIKKSLDGTSN